MIRRFFSIGRTLEGRLAAAYTWCLRPMLGYCGKDALIYFPVRFEHPENVAIGSGAILCPHSRIDSVIDCAGQQYNGRILIGKRSTIGYRVHISAALEVVIEDDVAIGSGAAIVDHTHDYRYIQRPVATARLSEPLRIRIGKGSSIGTNAMIGPGVQIGEHAVVSANALVLSDIPSYSVATGNPASAIRYYDPASKSFAATEHAQSVSALNARALARTKSRQRDDLAGGCRLAAP